MDELAFFRALPPGRMCCEAVADYLKKRGVDIPYPVSAMRRMWRRGIFTGCEAAAKRLGLSHVHPMEVTRGDVVLIQTDDGGMILGVRAGHNLNVAKAGNLLITRNPVVSAWRVECRQ